MNNNPLPSRILPLTSWRCIFIFCMVLCHCEVEWMNELTNSGLVFFFISSGFLLTLHHDPEELKGHNYWTFVKTRMLRMYPIHWLSMAIIIIYALYYHDFTHIEWPALIPNALLLQSYVPLRSWYFSYNGVSWFLSSILFCYICYPYVARALCRMSLKVQLSVITVVYIIYWIIIVNFVTLKNEAFITHVNPLVRLYEVCIGVVLFNCYVKLKSRFKTWSHTRATVLEFATLAFLIGLVLFSEFWDNSNKDCYNDSSMWEVPIALFILVIALNAGREGFIGRLLLWRPLVWLGERSLELFMLQGVAGLFFIHIFSHPFEYFGIPSYKYYHIGIFPVLILITWLCHKYFTIPLAKKFK